MTSLRNAIERARQAKRRGGASLDGPTGLAIAASLPSTEELADRFRRHDPTLSEALALEMGAERREELLGALEDLLTAEAGPRTDEEDEL